jgi:energy-coupling factor transport system ATP-binding protein
MTGLDVRFSEVSHTWSPRTPWANQALTNVSFELAASSRTAIVGPNGAGKSTVVQLLAGIVCATDGSVTIGGSPVLRGGGGLVGLAVQHPRVQLLRPTPGAEIRLVTGWTRSDPRIIEALDKVGLDGPAFLRRTIDSLSGGEQRRVQLALQLVRPAPVLVLDEPFAGVDKGGRPQISDLISKVISETQSTLVIVSHDVADTNQLVDRVLRFEQGHIVNDQRVEA